jgi:N-methylhydantoinase A/oxoprolinase/acetone carboxylase beta subunit
VDVTSIGTGGGSIAWIDPSLDTLRVGPDSAGAVPGPACYGLGGTEATVTDADLVAGRIPADTVLPGLGPVDLDAARAALARLGAPADAVLAVVDAAMELAVRRVSVERGIDPRGVALVAFGGAGPLHACTLAESLGMPAVIVPARAGVLSAVGILGAPHQVDRVESCPDPLDHDAAEEQAAALAEQAASGLGGADSVEVAFDCRYAGQSHELRVATIAGFAAEHERRNGYARPGVPVEVTAVRAVARRASPTDAAALPAPERRAVDGPAVVAEADCTIWVPDGWQARPGVGGALVLTRSGEAEGEVDP